MNFFGEKYSNLPAEFLQQITGLFLLPGSVRNVPDARKSLIYVAENYFWFL